MSKVLAIMNRELLALFCSPIGYITIAGFLVITGLLVVWTEGFSPGKPADLRGVFFWTPFVLTVFVPAISMRSISEEYRSGTIESLMTVPLSDTQMVIGKFLAAYFFYVVMLAGTLIYLVLMSAYGRPDWGASLSAYVGLLLVGASFTAFGLFTSSLTRNQIVAWIVGAVPLLLIACLGYFLANSVEGWKRDMLQQMNVVGRMDLFMRGLIRSDEVVFFVGLTLLWLFLSIKVVESRRWR
jgi:ABC-2 type transport system permease protein